MPRHKQKSNKKHKRKQAAPAAPQPSNTDQSGDDEVTAINKAWNKAKKSGNNSHFNLERLESAGSSHSGPITGQEGKWSVVTGSDQNPDDLLQVQEKLMEYEEILFQQHVKIAHAHNKASESKEDFVNKFRRSISGKDKAEILKFQKKFTTEEMLNLVNEYTEKSLEAHKLARMKKGSGVSDDGAGPSHGGKATGHRESLLNEEGYHDYEELMYQQHVEYSRSYNVKCASKRDFVRDFRRNCSKRDIDELMEFEKQFSAEERLKLMEHYTVHPSKVPIVSKVEEEHQIVQNEPECGDESLGENGGEEEPQPQSPEPQSPEPQSPDPQSPEPQSPEPQSPEPQSPEPQSPVLPTTSKRTPIPVSYFRGDPLYNLVLRQYNATKSLPIYSTEGTKKSILSAYNMFKRKKSKCPNHENGSIPGESCSCDIMIELLEKICLEQKIESSRVDSQTKQLPVEIGKKRQYRPN